MIRDYLIVVGIISSIGFRNQIPKYSKLHDFSDFLLRRLIQSYKIYYSESVKSKGTDSFLP